MVSNENSGQPVSPGAKKTEEVRCPRPYQLGKRQEVVDRNRDRMIEAAREVLLEPDFAGFTMEAVARKAGVSRQTVHNQYGSRRALLEAVFHAAASHSVLMELPVAFQRDDPVEGLLELVRIFTRFWSGAGVLTRRVRGLAALDPEFGETIAALDARRAGGIRRLVSRIQEKLGQPNEADVEEAVSAVCMLTSFECYDVLVKSGRNAEEISVLALRLTRAALRLEPRAPASGSGAAPPSPRTGRH